MYSVRLFDLGLAVKALEKKCPNVKTVYSIQGNVNGDFVIHSETDSWIVRHKDFSVWHLDRSKAKWGEWVKV